jgi:hypothetical protein
MRGQAGYTGTSHAGTFHNDPDTAAQMALVTVRVMFWQPAARLVRADFSAVSTVSRQRSLTATHSPTYRHRAGG